MATVSILSRDKAALQTALSQALPPDRSVWRCARRRPLLNRLQERRLRSSLHPAAFVEGDWQGAWVIEPAPSSPWSDSADLIDRFFVIDTARDAQWVLNAIHEADEAARGYFGAPPETSNYARQYRERYRWGASGAAELVRRVRYVLGTSDDGEGRFAASIVGRETHSLLDVLGGSSERLESFDDGRAILQPEAVVTTAASHCSRP